MKHATDYLTLETPNRRDESVSSVYKQRFPQRGNLPVPPEPPPRVR